VICSEKIIKKGKTVHQIRILNVVGLMTINVLPISAPLYLPPTEAPKSRLTFFFCFFTQRTEAVLFYSQR
jgi:hypothetical protein